MAMTDATVARGRGGGAAALFRAQAWAAAGLAAAYAVGLMVDPRFVGADPAWVKPLKFAVSLVVLYATVAAVVARLSPVVQAGRTVARAVRAMAGLAAFEMAYITLQAARGMPSHYLTATPLYAALYGAMAAAATGLVLAVAAVGLAAARDRGARLGPATREGVLWGFMLFALPLLVVAFSLGGNGGHHVGVHPAGGATVPPFGWSLVVGDLRPAHFLALHAMQALPLVGLAADRLGMGRWTVRLAGAGWLALTLADWAQALAGRPLLALQ